MGTLRTLCDGLCYDGISPDLKGRGSRDFHGKGLLTCLDTAFAWRGKRWRWRTFTFTGMRLAREGKGYVSALSWPGDHMEYWNAGGGGLKDNAIAVLFPHP